MLSPPVFCMHSAVFILTVITPAAAPPQDISIGVLHANAANARASAQLALAQIYREGILDQDTVQISVATHQTTKRVGSGGHPDESCGTAAVGVASLVLKDDCVAIIGPACDQEMDEVARMARDWNLPVIGYESPQEHFYDKRRYPTLARTSTANAEELAQGTVVLLRQYNWKHIALIVGRGIWQHSGNALESAPDVTIAYKLIVDQNMDAFHLQEAHILDDVKDYARVILVNMGTDLAAQQAVVEALYSIGVQAPEYVIVSARAHSDGVMPPWFTGHLDRTPSRELMRVFNNTFMVDIHFEYHAVEDFLHNVSQLSGHTETSVNLIPLYAAVYLYGLAVGRLVNESAGNWSKFTESLRRGREILPIMSHLTFMGVEGEVEMGHFGERVLLIDGYFVDARREHLLSVLDLTPTPIPGCDEKYHGEGKMNWTSWVDGGERCMFYTPEEHLHPRQFWPFNDGVLPADTPKCGFRGDKCWTTFQIALIVVAVVLVTTSAILAGFLYRRRIKAQLANSPWRLKREHVKLGEMEVKSRLSLVSASATSHTSSIGSSVRAAANSAMVNDTRATFIRYVQNQYARLNNAQLTHLNEIKKLNHANVGMFIGLCINQGNEVLILWSDEKRGSLQDILFDDNFDLDINFKTSFVKDVIKGMEYLHASPVGVHGRLSTVSCQISSHWSVKLYQFGLQNLFADLRQRGDVSPDEEQKNEDERLDAILCNITGCSMSELIQLAPELLRELALAAATDRKKAVLRGSVKGDIYSVGSVLYEILHRKEPYDHPHSIQDVLERLCNGKQRTLRPKIVASEDINFKVMALFEMCWSEEPIERPSIKRIKSAVDQNLKGNGNVVDHMMRMMEKYANNLEGIVKDRTAMFEEAQHRADNLLAQMLPRSVMEELKAGRQVAPTMYDGATVLFTDLVGFTDLCSASSPLEIVTLLNQLYSQFDSLIAMQDCYKVETIGDSYMVVSGVPQPNGDEHVREIAQLALGMLAAIRVFRVPHRPSTTLQIRLGFNSGAVAAGVVGLATPRYCLFGDTVNMASRMESSGEAMQIQISESARNLLVKNPSQFVTMPRGVIEVKGKGQQNTHWLLSKLDD